MPNLRRDIILIAIGAFLATAVQALKDLMNALFYPALFFPAGASLTNYEATQLILLVLFTLATFQFVQMAAEPTKGK